MKERLIKSILTYLDNIDTDAEYRELGKFVLPDYASDETRTAQRAKINRSGGMSMKQAIRYKLLQLQDEVINDEYSKIYNITR